MLLAAVALALAALAAPPKPAVSASPRAQFVLAIVTLRGTHWRRCPAAVRLSVHRRSGQTTPLRTVRPTTDGTFLVRWRPYRALSGTTVGIRASQACSGRTYRSSTTVRVLPTP